MMDLLLLVSSQENEIFNVSEHLKLNNVNGCLLQSQDRPMLACIDMQVFWYPNFFVSSVAGGR